VQAITASEGAAVNKPRDPTRADYVFIGWFSAAAGGSLYTWPHTVTANLTMHAHWRAEEDPPAGQYTLTFNTHGGSAIPAITADQGTAVAKPPDPVRADYVFTGWFSAETGGVLYAWPYPLTANATMHARWRAEGESPPAQYTLTFDTHGGSAIPAITADEGTAVSRPAKPAKEDHTFIAWYSTETGGAAYAWPHILTASVTMHAQWQAEEDPSPDQYTLTFDSHGGSPVAAITADQGTNVPEPAAPTRADHTFTGWYSAATGGTLYTWPHTLTAGVTMHARWTVNTTAQGITLTMTDFTAPPADQAGGAVTGGNITLTKPGGTETVTVAGAGTDVTWYIGLVQIGIGSNVTLYADTLSLGTHTLRVTAQYGGVRYSKELTVTVED
jgi:uncharacterized repeat protein (TIGR02543 family)